MTRRIDGPHLIGFGDFFVGAADRGYGSEIGAADRGYDSEIGATAKKVAAPVKTGGKGRPPKVFPYPKPKRTTGMEHHGKVLNAAHKVATKAAMTLGHVLNVLNAKPKPGVKQTVHVGAAAAAVMSPKAKLAVQKHNAAVVKAAQATKALAQHALKTKASVQALAKKMTAQGKLAANMRKPMSKRSHVGGYGSYHLNDSIGGYGSYHLNDSIGGYGSYHLNDSIGGRYGSYLNDAVGAAFEEFYTAVGADPDPNNPGYLTDGTPDPAFAAGAPGAAPAAGAPADQTAADLSAAGTDPSATDPTTLPAPPDMSTFIPDMAAVGGIAYDNSKGTPDGYVGSYNLYTRKTDSNAAIDSPGIDGTDHFGYVFGRYHDSEQPGGLPFGNELAPQTWNHVRGREDGITWHTWSDKVDPSEAWTSNTKISPNNVPYGPLVGNPKMADFAAMRVDANGNLFWLPQEAPAWLTFPIQQAAALTAKAAAKAAADAAAADAATAAKAAADAAAAQTAQDAANALAETQAASQAKIDQGTAETQAQQALVQQQQADTSQQAVETEQAKQAGDIMVAKAKRMQAYYEAHPEEEFAPAPTSDEEGGGDDGGDGGADDGGGDDGGGDDSGDGSDDGSGDDQGADLEQASSDVGLWPEDWGTIVGGIE